MGSERDFSLPVPPPPNPSARRQAIDAAMRKFDGIPEAPAPREPRRRLAWSTMHRRPAGALIAATLIAVIAIPAIQLGLPDRPAEEVRLPEVRNEPEDSQPAARQPSPAAEPPAAAADKLSSGPSATQPKAAPSAAAEDRGGLSARSETQKATSDAPLRMRAAPPPPPFMAAPAPPPPPAAEPQADAVAEDSGNIIVTGTRMPRPNLESASPITIVGVTSNDFLTTLRAALDADDRRAVMRLVALPLRVNFSSGRRTYRSSRDIERDFDRIFTPAVREAVSDVSPHDLATRDGGRMRGTDRIWFGCGKTLCRDEAAIKIREITP